MFADRVFETTTSTGTGAITVAGAQSGYDGFADHFANGAIVGYHERNADGSIWESGYGVLDTSAGTITRNLLASSTGSLINWGVGTKYIYSWPVSAVLSSMLSNHIGTTRKGFLPAGALWPRSGNSLLMYYNGSADVPLLPLTAATQGDLLYYGASGVPARLGAGTSGQVLTSGGAGANPAWSTIDVGGSLLGSLPDGVLWGLGVSHAADTAHDITIAAGAAMAADRSVVLALAAAITKRIDAAWAEGDGNGGLFAGAVANNTFYRLFLIEKDSDGTIDAGFDTDPDAANIPDGWTAYAPVCWVLTDGSANILPMIQRAGGDHFELVSPILDVDDGTPTNSDAGETYTLSVPPNCLGDLTVSTTGSAAVRVYARTPDVTDDTPVTNGVPLFTGGVTLGGGGTVVGGGNKLIWVNSSSQIKGSTVASTLYIVTHGWWDPRGRS